MTRLIVPTLALAALAACVAAPPPGRPISATLTSGERFTGSVADPSGGARAFTLVSDRGPTCTGQVTRAPGGGQATFSCSDGRGGSFPVVRGGGRATGTLGGQALVVELG